MIAKAPWTWTLVLAVVAIVTAATGLAATTLAPGAAPALAAGLLLVSLAATAAAFTTLAARLHRLELENEGLIVEISQEFDRVKDKIEIFGEALAPPRSVETEDAAEDAPLRRVVIK